MPSVAVDTTANVDLVAAPAAGLRIEILGWNLSAGGAVVVVLRDGAGSPVTLTTMQFGAAGDTNVQPVKPLEMACTAATKLQLTVSGAVRVTGFVHYKIVGFPAAS